MDYSLKEQLKDCFTEAKRLDKKYIAVMVKANDSKRAEIIINYNENIESKLNYYMKAYDEDLKLINAPSIKIIDFIYSDNLTDIERRFM